MLILNYKESQLLDKKGIKQRSLIYPSGLHANEKSFVLVRKVMEANGCENLTILL